MDTVKVDCRGMQCPAPILEIAKAARSVANQPAVLEIIADDDDFPNDVEAWCRTTRAELKTMRRDEQGHRAVIALNGAQFEGQGIVSRATVELPVAVLKQRPRHISEVMSANRSAPARRPEALGAAPAAPVAPPPVAAAPSVPEVMILPPDPILPDPSTIVSEIPEPTPVPVVEPPVASEPVAQEPAQEENNISAPPAASATPVSQEATAAEPAATPRRRGGGRKKGTGIPNWVPTRYVNDKADPFTSVVVNVNQAEGKITLVGTDSKGDHTYTFSATDINIA